MRDKDTELLEEAYGKVGSGKFVVVDPSGNADPTYGNSNDDDHGNGFEYGAYNLDGTGQWVDDETMNGDTWATNFHVFKSRNDALAWAQEVLRPIKRKYMVMSWAEWGRILDKKQNDLSRKMKKFNPS